MIQETANRRQSVLGWFYREKSMTNFQLSIPVKTITPEQLTAFFVWWAILGVALGTGLWYFASEIAPAIPFFHSLSAGVARVLYLVGVLIPGLFYVYIPLRLAVVNEHGTNIVVNQDGLGLPPALGGLANMPWLSWADIKLADLYIRNGKPAAISLMESGGKNYRLNIKDLEEQDVEQILLALEAWGANSIWTDALTNYRDNLQNKIRGIEGNSNTLEFNDELSRRFSATNFIPLEPRKRLRNGTLSIKRQMAFGGFSAVYEAEDTNSDTVVMKELVVSKFDNEAAREKVTDLFNREAELLAQLDHPQIVKLKDHFTEDGRKYMVLEHVSGRTLRDLVRHCGPLKQDQVIQLGLQMAGILRYLHGRVPPVVHRDFTPDNLVLQNDGTIVLIDFGAANEFLAEATGTLIGKQGYMSPEQIKGKAEPLSDIYSLGGTMFFMLTGKDPEALTPCWIESEEFGLALRVLIKQMTELSKCERPQSATVAGAHLLQIAQHAGISVERSANAVV